MGAVAARMGRIDLKAGGPEGTRGAHRKHAVHVRDAGRVEAQWLVEHRRALPRVERRAYVPEAGGGAKSSACRGGLNWRFGAGNGEERTWNMYFMSVVLEVSKLSGWLNADAYCRVEIRECDACPARCAGREAQELGRVGQHTAGASGAHAEDPRLEGWKGTRSERTWNMWSIVVTLDVSKLTGWLNLYARCRVKRRPCGGERGAQAGRHGN